MLKKFYEGDIVKIKKPKYNTEWLMMVRESTIFGGKYSGYGIDITRDKSTGLYIPNKSAQLWWYTSNKESLSLVNLSELEIKSFGPYLEKMRTKKPPTNPFTPRFDPELD